MWVKLFNGRICGYDSTDRKLLDAINWNTQSTLKKQALSFDQVLSARQKLLDYLENNGYPFAKIKLDSVSFVNQNWMPTSGS